jgi:hypothetical protein
MAATDEEGSEIWNVIGNDSISHFEVLYKYHHEKYVFELLMIKNCINFVIKHEFVV